MATYYADAGADWVEPLFSDAGNAYIVTGEYNLTTSITTSDEIVITKVPGGCKALFLLLSDGGSGATYDIGIDSDGDVLGNDLTSSDNGLVLTGLGEILGDAGDSVDIKVTFSAAPTASATLKVAVCYSIVDVG